MESSTVRRVDSRNCSLPLRGRETVPNDPASAATSAMVMRRSASRSAHRIGQSLETFPCWVRRRRCPARRGRRAPGPVWRYSRPGAAWPGPPRRFADRSRGRTAAAPAPPPAGRCRRPGMVTVVSRGCIMAAAALPSKPGDGDILADPQPEFRGHAVDHSGEPVAAGHDGVRAPVGPLADSSDRIFLRGVALVGEQHVRLVGGDAAGGQPVPEPGGPPGVPVVRRPVAQEGDPPEPLVEHVLHGADDGPAVVDIHPVLREQPARPPCRSMRTASPPRPAA